MSPHDRLVDLVLRCEELHKAGLPIDLEAICRDCPELLDDLRRLEQDGGLFATESGQVTHSTDTWAPPPPSAPKQVGDYEVLGNLGEGGMGVVYQGRHVTTQQLVALKLMRDGLASGPHLERFRREADTMKKLQHANIVQLLDAGQHDGRPFFAMELVTGGGLDRQLQGQPQPAPRAAQLVEVLARAVHDAHQAGVIHRDLKPSNVLVTPEGALKITDFGLAKRLDLDLRQTATGAILGTPSYIAPEQATGQVRTIGPTADVWALGVMLYEMLTGQLPFSGETAYETLQQVCGDDPKPPSQLQPKLPRDLETICLKCLHKSPAQRYASALELAEDLQRFQEDRPIKARRVGLSERLMKWRRRNPSRALACAALVLLVLGALGAAWYWDHHVRVKIGYYANFISRFGVKEGLGELSEEEVRGRGVSYKFYRRGGQVVQMDVVNGHGELRAVPRAGAVLERGNESSRKECRFKYERKQTGELAKETAEDRHGNVVWVLNYTSPQHAFYANVQGEAHAPGGRPDTRPGRGHAGRLATGLPEARTRSGAASMEFEWSAEGFAREVRYLDVRGQSHPDDGGVFELHQEHDERGLVVREAYRGHGGQAILHRASKVAEEVRQYDAQGNLIEESYLGIDGKPTLSASGHARITVRFDERGNQIEQAYFGIDGKPTLRKGGYARALQKYDERGNRTEWACFGLDDKPCLDTSDGTHRTAYKHDRRGNRIEAEYFGVDGKPTLHKDGSHKFTTKYDERRNAIELAFFGLNGKPCLDRTDATHLTKSRHDERGRKIESAYFGIDGKPTLHKDGNHKIASKYDERGNRIEVVYFGMDGKPTLHKDGYHKFTSKHDDRGNTLEVAYFGVDGKPTLEKSGHARSLSKYDERGNRIEWACFAADGKPCLDKSDGTHRTTFKHDEQGNLIEVVYYGVNGKPTLHKDGCHKHVSRYDEQGHRIEQTYFDVEDSPARLKAGYARVKRKFDARGNRIELAYFTPDGKPCLEKTTRTHRTTQKYDAQGNRIESAYFGMDGKPTLHKDGSHKLTTRYDERNNVIELAYFGVDGKPCPDRGDGTHLTTFKHDDRGNVIEIAYFGIDGKPTLHKDGNHKVVTRYDARDNRIETAYFGVAGKPTLHKDGHHKTTIQYDERDNVIAMSYFGIDRKPTQEKRGYARVTRKYDRRGNRIEWACFGVDGKPCPDRTDGTHRTTSRFDEQGNLIELAYFGVDGGPTLHKGSYQKQTYRYNEQGNQIEQAYFGIDGKPTLLAAGYARITRKYDGRGNRIEWACFAADGKPCLDRTDSTHRTASRYDERGNRIESTFFGTAGEPVLHKDGYHKYAAKYDDGDNAIELAYFAVDGKPCVDRSDGTHRTTYRHDEQGNTIESAFFGVDGKPTLYNNSHARITYRRDDYGALREATWFGLSQRPIRTRWYGPTGGLLRALNYPNGDPAVGKDVAKWQESYDSQGRMTEVVYWDSAGRLVRMQNGYARYTVTYDAGGVPSRSYYDAKGEPVSTRVVVQRVVPNSLAQRLRLQRGDVFLRYDDRPVTQLARLIHTFRGKPGNPLRSLVVLRDGKTFAVQVTSPLGVELADVVPSTPEPKGGP